MKCAFCEKTVDSVKEASELGWYPDFFAGEVSYQGPICPECRLMYFFTDEDGEVVLKPGCAVPPTAIPESLTIKSLKFFPGQVVATPDALKAIEDAGQTPDFFLDKHIVGDWGEVDAFDSRANDEALTSGDRILSAYRTLKNDKILIITEAVGDDGQREATTISMPEQY